jgi:hypothetical protein
MEYEFVPGPANHRDASVISSPVGFACRADERPRDGIERPGRNPNPVPDCVEPVGSLARDGPRALCEPIEARPTKQPFSAQASGAAVVLEGGSSGKVCRPSALESYRRLDARYGVSVVGWTDGGSGRNGQGG